MVLKMKKRKNYGNYVLSDEYDDMYILRLDEKKKKVGIIKHSKFEIHNLEFGIRTYHGNEK